MHSRRSACARPIRTGDGDLPVSPLCTASIAVSALVSLTLAPMLASRFMRPESHDHGPVYRFIEVGFDAMLSFYRRTLDVVLRHQRITLAVFFITMGLTGVMKRRHTEVNFGDRVSLFLPNINEGKACG
jgi:Cu/Ag efflux pump CusA